MFELDWWLVGRIVASAVAVTLPFVFALAVENYMSGGGK